MILFADNDIFLKLTGCDLLHEFINCLSLTQENICVAPSLKYSIKGQMKKSFLGEGAENATNVLSEFLKNVKVTDELSNEQNEFLTGIAVIPKIDSGEALLLTHAFYNATSKIATGDKSCLKAVIGTNHLLALQQSLQGRVYTLELAMLMLIERLNFDVVNEKVTSRCIEDTVLKMAFGQGKTKENAVACLSSYTKEFLMLLAEPQLIGA